LNHTRTFEEIKKSAVDDVQSYYDQVSYGKIKVRGEIIPGWRMLPIRCQYFNVFKWDYSQQDMTQIDNTALAEVDRLAGASEYQIKFIVYAGKVWGHARSNPRASFMNENSCSGTYIHELGHVLGLPDYYSYKLSEKGQYSSVNVGPWDVMSSSSYAGELCSYSKITLGWIQDQQIVDVRDKYQGTFVVDALSNRTAKIFAARIYVTSRVAYYVEVRERLGLDSNVLRYAKPGVVIFRIDELGNPREGGVTVIDSHPGSGGNKIETELYDAAFSTGKGGNVSFIDREKDFSIIVLDKVGLSYKIMLADPASGELANQANAEVAQAEDSIKQAENEQRLSGLEKAKDQLNEARRAFGRSAFTEATSSARTAVQSANSAVRTSALQVGFLASSTTILAVTAIGILLLLGIVLLMINRRHAYGRRPPSQGI
ncbi:MAG: immune inhibitor A domain-containing protein, partial [archaeon]